MQELYGGNVAQKLDAPYIAVTLDCYHAEKPEFVYNYTDNEGMPTSGCEFFDDRETIFSTLHEESEKQGKPISFTLRQRANPKHNTAFMKFMHTMIIHDYTNYELRKKEELNGNNTND